MVTKGWQNKIKAKTHWDWLLCAATLLLEHRRPSSDTILASAAVGTGLETFILIGSSNNKTAASTTLTAPHFKIPRTFIWRYNLSSDHPVLIPFLSARLNFEFLFGFIPPPPRPTMTTTALQPADLSCSLSEPMGYINLPRCQSCLKTTSALLFTVMTPPSYSSLFEWRVRYHYLTRVRSLSPKPLAPSRFLLEPMSDGRTSCLALLSFQSANTFRYCLQELVHKYSYICKL